MAQEARDEIRQVLEIAAARFADGELEHRATFDQFAEMHAKQGPAQHPLFAWLTSQPGFPGDVKWNFNKWLIGRNGELLGRWSSDAAPDGPEITAAIEAALG